MSSPSWGPASSLDCGGREVSLQRPCVVGIVNVTPDSFSDGGRHQSVEAAVAHGLALAEAGAGMLDIGGESTRPGAPPVSLAEELDRVIPVIEALSARCPLPLAVDTYKPEVMRAAAAAGAGMINDIYALRREGALDTVAELGLPVCIMHMQGEPGTMQAAPEYGDVVGEVQRFLADRLLACEFAGIERRKVLVDPGFGFGKTVQHNLLLLSQLHRFQSMGGGIYVGLSRKSMLGAVTGRRMPEQRAAASAAAALIAAQRGAQWIRVHDVAETVDALAVWAAVAEHDATVRPAPAASMWPDDED